MLAHALDEREVLSVLTLRALLVTASAWYASSAGASPAYADVWVARASAGLEPRIIGALRQIAGPDRRLLALHSYLRANASVAEHWSWSRDQIAAYPTTPEGKAAAREIDAARISCGRHCNAGSLGSPSPWPLPVCQRTARGGRLIFKSSMRVES